MVVDTDCRRTQSDCRVGYICPTLMGCWKLVLEKYAKVELG